MEVLRTNAKRGVKTSIISSKGTRSVGGMNECADKRILITGYDTRDRSGGTPTALSDNADFNLVTV
jgi:hypothetical protein